MVSGLAILRIVTKTKSIAINELDTRTLFCPKHFKNSYIVAIYRVLGLRKCSEQRISPYLESLFCASHLVYCRSMGISHNILNSHKSSIKMSHLYMDHIYVALFTCIRQNCLTQNSSKNLVSIKTTTKKQPIDFDLQTLIGSKTHSIADYDHSLYYAFDCNAQFDLHCVR